MYIWVDADSLHIALKVNWIQCSCFNVSITCVLICEIYFDPWMKENLSVWMQINQLLYSITLMLGGKKHTHTHMQAFLVENTPNIICVNSLDKYSPTIPIFEIKPQIMQTTQMLIIDLITATFCMWFTISLTSKNITMAFEITLKSILLLDFFYLSVSFSIWFFFVLLFLTFQQF